MNKRAFTLTELIAVIVIISLILLTAVPAVYKLLTDNKDEKYDYYYKMVEEAAKVYAKSQKDTLGNSLSTGCLSTNVDTLVNEGFLKTYTKDNEEVLDSQIIIYNNYGKLSFSMYLKIGTESSVSYEKGEKQDTSSCVSYNPKFNDILFAKFETDEDGYITTNTNNYIWYSGKLWRAIWVDKNTKQVKLITNEIVGIVPYNYASTNNQFKNSYIEKWLNDYFLKSLYNPNKYLSTYKWEYKSNSFSSEKIGLITHNDTNKFELNKKPYYWTLEAVNTGYVYLNDGLTKSYSSSYGVKPSIVLKSNIKVVGSGTGTASNPYQLEGNKIESQKDKKLNTRYSGEYVKINNDLYRIVNIIDNKTKLIAVDSVDNKTIADITNSNTLFYEGLVTSEFDDLLTTGLWYVGDNLNAENYTLGTINNNIRMSKIGIPVYTEIVYFNSEDSGKTFWTLTQDHDNENKMMGITYRGEGTSIDKTSTASVKYLLYIKEDVPIQCGEGTFEKPFVIKGVCNYE